MKSLGVFLTWCLISLHGRAGPLFFPAQKNHVDVLAQNFLYSLDDSHHLRIGDTLIDDRKIRFVANVVPGEVRLTFQWPASLITEGRISLLDSTGKALWSQDFNPRRVSVVKDPTAAATGPEIRTELARLTTEPLPTEVWDRAKFLPFLMFCVSREAKDAKFYLCSGNFYVNEKPDGTRVIMPRFSGLKEAFVEINGSAATRQGVIYLNDSKQNLFMRAQLENGAAVEILTHRGQIDFKDAIFDEGGQSLLVTAHGTEPVQKAGLRKDENGDTQVSLPRERPTYYLSGEAGVPMRQEFSINGDVPKEADRPKLDDEEHERTYRSSVTLRGTAAHGTNVTESAGHLRDLGDGRFSWTLADLEVSDVPQRRYLDVIRGPEKFVAAYDVRRGLPREADFKLSARLPNTFALAEASYKQWMESLLWLPGSWARFHWAWSVADRLHLKTPADGPEIDQLNFGLHYRFTPGFPGEFPTWTAGLLYGQFRVVGANATGSGIELGYEMPAPVEKYPWMVNKIDWLTANFRLWPSATGADTTLGTSWETNVLASRRLGKYSFVRLGAGLSQYKTSLALPKEGPQLDVNVGYGLNF